MGTCNDGIGQTLAQRLLAHAALHESLIEFDHCEQRRWADDLRDAAAEIERLRSEVAVLRDANARWPAVVAAERERCAKLADEYATWGGSSFCAWFTKLAAAIRAERLT